MEKKRLQGDLIVTFWAKYKRVSECQVKVVASPRTKFKEEYKQMVAITAFSPVQMTKGYKKTQNGEQAFCTSSLVHISDMDVNTNLNEECDKLCLPTGLLAPEGSE